MNLQQSEGVRIAATRQFTEHDGFWTVPQGKNKFHYHRLTFTRGQYHCTCREFERLRPHWCRHLYALREVLQKRGASQKPIPRPPAKTHYPRDWRAYNEGRGQKHKEFKLILRELCRPLPTPRPTSKGGRPMFPVPDLVYAAVMKVRCHEAAQEMESLLEEERKLRNIQQIPEASTVLNFFNSAEASEILLGLIGQCCLPFRKLETQFAIDATSFPIPRRRRWYNEETQKPKNRRECFKAHISSGVESNIIAAVRATPDTGERTGDASQFPYLLSETAKRFRVLRVLADAAYCSDGDFELAHQLGAGFTTRFTKRDKGRGGGDHYRRAFLFQWQRPKEHFERYGKRNNVESTCSVLKREFPGKLFFKNNQALENEILCIALIHDIHCLIMAKYTLGLDVEVWKG